MIEWGELAWPGLILLKCCEVCFQGLTIKADVWSRSKGILLPIEISAGVSLKMPLRGTNLRRDFLKGSYETLLSATSQLRTTTTNR